MKEYIFEIYENIAVDGVILSKMKEEVVRCKDCKYNASSKKCLHPDSFILVPDDNDYCSYAERREDE